VRDIIFIVGRGK